MEEIIKNRILELIGRDPNMDGIDISFELSMAVDKCYPLLRKMEEEGLIKRTSTGMGYRYRLVRNDI